MASERVSLAGLAGVLGSVGGPLDYQPSLKLVAVYLAAQARRSFDEGRGPDGRPWRPLKKPSKRRGGASAKPLRDTGLLMASLSARGAQHVEEYQPAALEFGTAVRYGRYHQDGTRTIPARPFLGTTPAMDERIGEIVADQLARQVADVFRDWARGAPSIQAG